MIQRIRWARASEELKRKWGPFDEVLVEVDPQPGSELAVAQEEVAAALEVKSLLEEAVASHPDLVSVASEARRLVPGIEEGARAMLSAAGSSDAVMLESHRATLHELVTTAGLLLQWLRVVDSLGAGEPGAEVELLRDLGSRGPEARALAGAVLASLVAEFIAPLQPFDLAPTLVRCLRPPTPSRGQAT